ncbi:hypothetical protein P1X15_27710 [Runella sp. MFBS21]|uniref:hypothetical protein n=1 Tax=Runella sp. MFBS21 TaxID=3034018 RepID=UPI0023F82DDB|nr:hypothetical protein [Runella sp. MFBS21]MDF7821439.1 hypothetical protein [Runella sp. MFBS21]
MDKDSYIPKVVEWVKRKGYEQIKANLEGFEVPIAYERQNDDERFIPDVTAKLLYEKSYFEVVLKTDNPDRVVSKLRLLSMLASQKGGRLFMMAPSGHLNFVKELALKHSISGEVVKIA